jgi:cell division protein FtsZ
VNEAAEIIKEAADPEANIIFGTVIDERMGDDVSITVIATGFDSSRRRDYARGDASALQDVGAGTRTGRDNRDFLRELERERERMADLVPAEHGERAVETAARRPTYETEDLDIPAFLRRNR